MKKLFAVQKELAPGLGKFALPSSSVPKALVQRYSTSRGEDDSEDVLEKARSTGDQFLRQAKEKSESLKETASEMVDGAKEGDVGEEDEAGGEKFRGRVEKGPFDHK